MGQDAQHAARVVDALATDAAARQAVVASWRRSSLLHKLDPERKRVPDMLTAQELRLAQERIGPLVGHSQAILDQLYRAVGDVGCCVLLAGADGVPVARRGAIPDDETFQRWGLWTGAVWSEQHEGTNGIGTAIAEERALTIHKDQHFHAKNTELSCTAAPIFDHKGKLAAVVDVSSCRADLTAAFSRLISVAVSDAAHRIETEAFRRAFDGNRALLVEDGSGGSAGMHVGPALIAVDGDDMLVGATRRARRLYKLSDEDFRRGVPLGRVFGETDQASDLLAHAERRALHQALALAHGNVSAAARSIGVSRATIHRKMKRLGLNEH